MDINVATRIALAESPYIPQRVPALYTALTVGPAAFDPRVYGDRANAYVVKYNDIVEIVVNNQDSFDHPMHLHGHTYQVVARGSGDFNGDYSKLPKSPMKRDTATTQPNGHMVIRFRANNPGAWLFHCHMEWHMEAGMVMTIVEAPDVLQKSGIQIPKTHLDLCRRQNNPTSGNCGGDSRNVDSTNSCINSESRKNNHYGALVTSNQSSQRRARDYRNMRL